MARLPALTSSCDAFSSDLYDPLFGAHSMAPMYNPAQEQSAILSTGAVGNAAWSFVDDSLYCPADVATSSGAHHVAVLPPSTTFQGNSLDATPSSHSFFNQTMPVLPSGSIHPQFQWQVQPSSSWTVDHYPNNIWIDLLPDCCSLWNQFYAAGNEMILTKAGRQIFPPIIVAVKGLELDAMYNMVLEIPCIDGCRYKYTKSRWVKASTSDFNFSLAAADAPFWKHPDGPNTGRCWMEVPVSFKNAKITNNPKTTKGHIVLRSLYKYLPQLNIMKETPAGSDTYKSVFIQRLPVCEFVTVTAYHNYNITQMKIDYNPFAKSLRTNSWIESKESGGAYQAPAPLLHTSMPAPYMVAMQPYPLNSHPSNFFPGPTSSVCYSNCSQFPCPRDPSPDSPVTGDPYISPPPLPPLPYVYQHDTGVHRPCPGATPGNSSLTLGTFPCHRPQGQSTLIHSAASPFERVNSGQVQADEQDILNEQDEDEEQDEEQDEEDDI